MRQNRSFFEDAKVFTKKFSQFYKIFPILFTLLVMYDITQISS